MSIVSVGPNPHGHPHPTRIERLRARGAVYLTGPGDSRTPAGVAPVAGDVSLVSRDGLTFTVNGDRYRARDPVRVDLDGDGYFREVDPDDTRATVQPPPFGGCNPRFQPCPGG